MMYYVGIVEGADDAWGVRIPDCPGCHGAGATPEAAISDAISALREWAAQMASLYRQHAQRQKSSLTPKTTRMWPLVKPQYSFR
jgi:predicted RNase H-like HicB family nuclease